MSHRQFSLPIRGPATGNSQAVPSPAQSASGNSDMQRSQTDHRDLLDIARQGTLARQDQATISNLAATAPSADYLAMASVANNNHAHQSYLATAAMIRLNNDLRTETKAAEDRHWAGMDEVETTSGEVVALRRQVQWLNDLVNDLFEGLTGLFGSFVVGGDEIARNVFQGAFDRMNATKEQFFQDMAAEKADRRARGNPVESDDE